ncbi:hypothetical protein B484DRAFT_453961 [Ochromonadaceae sp. CCMP2298]|nr:hypothetical protein B484DRAFT_453961 [Ochromonadaceae sp. CCMP2298]
MSELHTRVGGLEASLKAQLKEELRGEREGILGAMAAQSQALAQSIHQLHLELAADKRRQGSLLDGLVISQVSSVKLPPDVKQWRSAHVQAWVSFEKELPAYAPHFQRASVDGLVLLRHVTMDTLQGALGITDRAHCLKILEGVQQLQQRQGVRDEEAERERLHRLQRKREEEDRHRQNMAEAKAQAEKKVKPEGRGKGGKGTTARARRAGRRGRSRPAALGSSSTRGRPGPGRSGTDPWRGRALRRTVAPWHTRCWAAGNSQRRGRGGGLDMGDTDTGDMGIGGVHALPRPPSSIKVRRVARSCAPEEVLALLRGAMGEVGGWLVRLRRIEWGRAYERDSDLREDELALRVTGLDDRGTYGVYGAGTEKEGGGYLDEEGGGYLDEEGGGYLDEEGEEPPPAYDELDSEESAPPSYRELAGADAGGANTDEGVLASVRAPAPPLDKLTALYLGPGTGAAPRMPAFDPLSLVFEALVGQHNNNASWLGSNEKLTRTKLYGGLESLLRLKVEWPQFDALWTQLDAQRSGDIDLQEFRRVFGGIERFAQTGGAGALNSNAQSKSLRALSRCLFELCDALRGAGFTVVDMFAGFDRNGSGDVSVSEFCSLLRLVVGSSFEKRLIHQALAVLDTDGDKAVSLEELLRFVYRVWRTQLDELAVTLARIDNRDTGGAERRDRLLEQRRHIKEAVKKNFPREWRDRLEREGGHAIPGPFQALLQRMDVGGVGTASSPTSPPRAQFPPTPIHLDSPTRPRSAAPSSGRPRPSEATWSPSSTRGAQDAQTNGPTPLFATAPSASRGGELMRFRIKMPAGSQPTRAGKQLRSPPPTVIMIA